MRILEKSWITSNIRSGGKCPQDGSFLFVCFLFIVEVACPRNVVSSRCSFSYQVFIAHNSYCKQDQNYVWLKSIFKFDWDISPGSQCLVSIATLHCFALIVVLYSTCIGCLTWSFWKQKCPKPNFWIVFLL